MWVFQKKKKSATLMLEHTNYLRKSFSPKNMDGFTDFGSSFSGSKTVATGQIISVATTENL